MDIGQKRKQVADQCRVVSHIAEAIAKVHADLAKVYETYGEESLIELVGKHTAYRMEILDNILNNMDAGSPDDDWCDPIFAKAHEIFPVEVPFQ